MVQFMILLPNCHHIQLHSERMQANLEHFDSNNYKEQINDYNNKFTRIRTAIKKSSLL